MEDEEEKKVYAKPSNSEYYHSETAVLLLTAWTQLFCHLNAAKSIKAMKTVVIMTE